MELDNNTLLAVASVCGIFIAGRIFKSKEVKSPVELETASEYELSKSIEGVVLSKKIS